MESKPRRESIAGPLSLALAIAAAFGYIAVWSLLGFSGCGPAAHSADGRIFEASPFAMLGLSAAAVLLVAGRLKWRRRTVLGALAMTLGTAAVLEFLVFMLQFGAHHCGE